MSAGGPTASTMAPLYPGCVDRVERWYRENLKAKARAYVESAFGYDVIDWRRAQSRAIRKGCMDPRRLCRRPP